MRARGQQIAQQSLLASAPTFSPSSIATRTRHAQVRASHTKQTVPHRRHSAACAPEANNSFSNPCQRVPPLFLHLPYTAHTRRAHVRASRPKLAMSHRRDIAACAHETDKSRKKPCQRVPLLFLHLLYTTHIRHTQVRAPHTKQPTSHPTQRGRPRAPQASVERSQPSYRSSAPAQPTRPATHPAVPASECPYFSSIFCT